MADPVYMAKLAEQAERYDEMVTYMKQFAESNPDLGLEERNLLSVAYKNVVGARRASLRIIGSIAQKEAEKGTSRTSLVSVYKEKVAEELQTICYDILSLLDQTLIKDSLDAEPVVFYQKMKVRCLRHTHCSCLDSLAPLCSDLLRLHALLARNE